MPQKMKWCAGILAALVAAVCLQGCEQSRHLKVAAHVWPGYECMHLAKELDWLDPHQLELVQTAFAGESLETLIAGHVDALVTYEPVASQLQEQGATVVFDSGQAHNLIVDVLAIRADRLHWPHVGALRRLVAAHFRALEHFQRNPQDAAYRMAPRLSLKPNEVSAAFSGLVLPDIENNYRLLGGDAPRLLDSATELSSLMRSRGLLHSNEDDLGRLIDDRYLPAIEAK